MLRYESDEAQEIKTDGSHVIVINKIDKHMAKALTSKLDELKDQHHGLTRTVINEFLTYVRGFLYHPLTKQAKLAVRHAGFNVDIYFQNLEVAQKLHYDPKNKFHDLREDGQSLPPGQYIKKPVPTTAIFIDSPIAYKNQKFEHGALLHISSPREDGIRDISFVDPTDIEDCYTWMDGSSLVDKQRNIQLPHYTINQQHEVTSHSKTDSFTPEDVKDLPTITVKTQSSRVYIKPDARFFAGQDSISFFNEADHVTQSLDAKDGVVISAFNYRKTNDDYDTKAEKFHQGVKDAHTEAKNFADLIHRISMLYRILDIGTPDIYTSTREKMKLPKLEGVDGEVVLKDGTAELLRVVAPSDIIKLHRSSDHRSDDQTYVGEAFVQITDRGNLKYEKFRGVQSQFAATAYIAHDGKPLQLADVPSYSIDQVKGPKGMAEGTGQAVSAGEPVQKLG